jgi:hypothetical protein
LPSEYLLSATINIPAKSENFDQCNSMRLVDESFSIFLAKIIDK